jgi:formylglycine-generating enzyme required for sulfatase activity
MAKLVALGLFFLSISCSLLGQNNDFFGNPGVEDPCDELQYESNADLETLMKEIMGAFGMLKNPYILQPCTSISNCQAKVSNGKSYILYNPSYIGKIRKLNFSSADTPEGSLDWAIVGVLAHEVGHHINAHHTSTHLSNHQMELEADYLAGYILYMLGATDFQEASACLRTVREESSPTHPGRQQRIVEFGKGWSNAQQKLLKGKGTTAKSVDSDGDGIFDNEDECPNEFGSASTKGCPDSDNDGVPNGPDRCPYAAGPLAWSGCPDSDEDGIPDHEDGCPTLAGTKQTRGCPDRDKDGVPDSEDRCPDRPGPAADNGCPPADIDGDGVPDISDRCKTEFGLRNLQGCPDSDGDGIPDVDDKCPMEKGLPLKGGCPESGGEFISDPLLGKLVLVKGGTFKMGCTLEQAGCESDEFPAHTVTLGDYYLSETEVTQYMWKSVMGNTAFSAPNCDECPVESVSWEQVQVFINQLNNKVGAGTYRLPSEAEWEYAARGGSKSKGYRYAGSNNPAEVSWSSENSGNTPKPVKGKKPNELGLYDMSGNVWEWCSSMFGSYRQEGPDGPPASSNGVLPVCRGGGWNYPPTNGRVSDRNLDDPSIPFNYIGFRLAKSAN